MKLKSCTLYFNLIVKKHPDSTEDELLSCPGFSEQGEETTEEIDFSLVFGGSVHGMIKVANRLRKRLKRREKLLEEIT